MSFHPLVNARIRLKMFSEMVSKGMGPLTALKKLSSLSREQVETKLNEATVQHAATLPKTFMVAGKLGDGHILKAIEDFFNSPLGKAILQVAVALLMALIAV